MASKQETVATLIVAIIAALVMVFDILTLPIYYLIQKPFKKLALSRRAKAKVVINRSKKDGAFEVTYRSIKVPYKIARELKEDRVDTMDKFLDWVNVRHGKEPIVGTRKILGTTWQDGAAGSGAKKLKKYSLADEYTWTSLREAIFETSLDFGRGLTELMGIKAGDKVVIYADTRVDWMVSAFGCFQAGCTVVTVYTNLGRDGVAYGINLTGAPVVVVSQELLPRLLGMMPELPKVRGIVYLEEPWNDQGLPDHKDHHKVLPKVVPFGDILEAGKKTPSKTMKNKGPSNPKPNDPAVIMFTSGSTGLPKGVILTHRNLTSAIQSIIGGIGDVMEWEEVQTYARGGRKVYMAFLPLAHVLELLAECCMLASGISLAYSTPYTLMDSGTMIPQGTRGDASIAKPLVMACVPLVMDRICKGIKAKVKAEGPLKEKLFQFCYQYRSKWLKRGFDTPIMKRLVLAKTRAAVGGQLCMMLCGGAALSEATQDFVSTVLGVAILQGYGLTETAAVGCIADPDDLSALGVVGPPLPGIDLKLVSWAEGGYTVDDPTGPRGEIIIGGRNVAAGYYELPDKTREDFDFQDGDDDVGAKTWFRTGDIGQVLEDGSIKIIDRKKDLAKLQGGEYVSLGKVEAVLKSSPMFDNVCVVARSQEHFTVAVVTPDRSTLDSLATSLGLQGVQPEEDEDIITVGCGKLRDAVSAHILEFGLKNGLVKFEIPRSVVMAREEWTPESGLVTAAMKIRRRQIEDKYSDMISEAYAELNKVGTVFSKSLSSSTFSSSKISPV